MKLFIILLISGNLLIASPTPELIEPVPQQQQDTVYAGRQTTNDKKTTLKIFGSILFTIFMVGFWVEDGRE